MAWEIEFLNWMQGMRNPVLDWIMGFFSFIGEAGVFWILVSIVLLFFKKTRRMGIQALCAMAITYIIGNLILKPAFDRARPFVNELAVFAEYPPLRRIPHDASFPSGHTMNGITCALTYLFIDKRFGIPAIIVALIIAFSRLYNYCHFPTDVIGGIVVGTVCAIAVHLIFKAVLKKREAKA